jgi:hypothetical protein
MVKEAETKLNEGANKKPAGSEEPKKKLAELGQPDRYSQLGQIVLERAQYDTLHVINWRIHAALDFFLGKEFFDHGVFVAQISEPENPDKKVGEEEAVNLAHEFEAWLRTAVNVIGWRWTYGWRRDSRPATLAMIFIPLPYILTHAEALHGPRLPLDGVLLCYVAFVLCLPILGTYLAAGSAAVKPEKV